MKALDIRCPSCGNPSLLTDSKAFSRASVSAAFKCSNTACRREFGGVFTLAAGTPPGIESFSSGRTSSFAGDSDKSKKWIGVDFDGTLAEEHSNGRMGDPIAAMVARVKQWRDDGYEVRIFTARAHDPDQVKDIRGWLRNNSLPDLPITNVKDPNLLELWDDKAVRVQHNQGKPCTGCKPDGKLSRQSGAPVFTPEGIVLADC